MKPFIMAHAKGKGTMNSSRARTIASSVTVGALAGFAAAILAAGAAAPALAGSTVPDVISDTPARAEHILASHGYKWKTIPAHPHGRSWFVDAETPRAGTPAPAGTVVTLKLLRHGTGTATVAVPDVRGDTYAAARHILAYYGLRARRSAPGNYTVRHEHPAAGTVVARGSTVKLSPAS